MAAPSSAQVHRELVAAHAGMTEALAQRFLAMLLAMQDVPAVLIGWHPVSHNLWKVQLSSDVPLPLLCGFWEFGLWNGMSMRWSARCEH